MGKIVLEKAEHFNSWMVSVVLICSSDRLPLPEGLTQNRVSPEAPEAPEAGGWTPPETFRDIQRTQRLSDTTVFLWTCFILSQEQSHQRAWWEHSCRSQRMTRCVCVCVCVCVCGHHEEVILLYQQSDENKKKENWFQADNTSTPDIYTHVNIRIIHFHFLILKFIYFQTL